MTSSPERLRSSLYATFLCSNPHTSLRPPCPFDTALIFRPSQYFKENPFFSEKVLKKEFKYIPPPSGSGDVDENGLTAAHIDFAWERDVDAQVCCPPFF